SMDHVVVRCPKCSLGHRLPVAQQGEVICQKCGERFQADTRKFDRSMDDVVREVGLEQFEAASGAGGQPSPTPIRGGGLTSMFGASEAACPHCRHVMKVGLTESQCPHCDHYSRARDG